MTRICRAADLVYIKRQDALGQCNIHVLLTSCSGAIPLHVTSTSNEFSWGYRIDDCVSIITKLRYKSCCEVDNCSASVMRSRCPIHNTKPATTRRVLLTSTKMGNHENPHGKSTNWCETRCCVAKMQRLWKHLEYCFSWRQCRKWVLSIEILVKLHETSRIYAIYISYAKSTEK